MKIMMLSWEFPPNISGGLGVACFGLSKAIVQAHAGASVTVVVPEIRGNEDRRFVNVIDADDLDGHPRSNGPGDGATWWDNTVSRVAIGRAADSSGCAAAAGTKFASGPASSSNVESAYSMDHKVRARRFARLLGAKAAHCRGFDLVHAHDWLTFEAGLVLKAACGIPLVVHVHSTEWDRSGGAGDAEIVEIERRGMNGSDRIVAVSDFTRDVLVGRYNQRSEKIATVYNGSDVRPHFAGSGASSGKRRVCFVGRITRQKAPECFIRAAHRVLQHRPDVEFVMAGDGDLRDMIIKMSRSLGLDGAMTFPGFLSRDEVIRLLESSDVYVMPSVSEPFGIAALEAVNAGVPVILSRSAGITEVIRSAPRIDWWNVDALVEAILEFLNCPEHARQVAARCAQEAESLSWISAAEKLLVQYDYLSGR